MAVYDYTENAEDLIVDGDGPSKPRPKKNHRPIRMPFGHDPEKDAELSDYRDDMTLDEVRDNDIAMAMDAIKNAKRYVFNTAQQCESFRGHCMGVTMKRIGIVVAPGMDAKFLEKKMKKEKIVIENRVKDPHGGLGSFYKGQDAWRNGLYVYKAGELVAFISCPMIDHKHPWAVSPADIPLLEDFDRLVMDGKGSGLAKQVKGTISLDQVNGKPFIVTNAKVNIKGYR